MKSCKVEIRQIFYNDETRSRVRPYFIPLDNTNGRPDWFEFWPILHFLRSNPLEPDTWYGFVSPKFPEKTGISWQRIHSLLEENPDADVALISPFWTSLAVCKNPWLQGERDHPGLVTAMERFMLSQGISVSIASSITHFDNSVNSNYFIGKAGVWRSWQELAEAYLNYVEGAGYSSTQDMETVKYRERQDINLKVFVQERLINWVLLQRNFRVIRPDYEVEGKVAMFYDTRWARWLYGRCDGAKRAAVSGQKRRLWLSVFHVLRLTIAVLQRIHGRGRA